MARRTCGGVTPKEANLTDPRDAWVASVFGVDPRDFADAAQGFGHGLDERAMTVRQSPAEIDAVIQKNLRSPEKGLRLEGEIGKLIADERFSVLSAGRQVGLNGSTGEIDLETDEAIIECYSASNGKLAQIKKLVRDAAMNPSGKPVVLYAPSYGGMAARDIVAAGARVAKTPDELVAILKSLRGK